MPTHIHNTLKIRGSEKQIIEVKYFLKGSPDKDGNPMYIDFNNIVKMPEELKIRHNTVGELAQFVLFDSDSEDELAQKAKRRFDELDKETKKEAIELAEKYEENYQKYGHTTWYSWSWENWRTKLNAYQQQMPDEKTIWFDTAYNHATVLIIKVSRKFPEIKFHYAWEVECGGPSAKFNIKNGEVEILKQSDGQIF